MLLREEGVEGDVNTSPDNVELKIDDDDDATTILALLEEQQAKRRLR